MTADRANLARRRLILEAAAAGETLATPAIAESSRIKVTEWVSDAVPLRVSPPIGRGTTEPVSRQSRCHFRAFRDIGFLIPATSGEAFRSIRSF
ncbi:MAG: hypothetical protein AAGC57_07460 [Pseudomonadota bacterium]